MVAKKMIQVETVWYEAVARILFDIRDNLDDISLSLETLVVGRITNEPNVSFEELVTLILQDRETSRAIFDALA